MFTSVWKTPSEWVSERERGGWWIFLLLKLRMCVEGEVNSALVYGASMSEDYSRGSVFFFHVTWVPKIELKSSGMTGRCITHWDTLLSQVNAIKIILPVSVSCSLRPHGCITFFKNNSNLEAWTPDPPCTSDNVNGHVVDPLWPGIAAACYMLGASHVRHTKELGPCPLTVDKGLLTPDPHGFSSSWASGQEHSTANRAITASL